MVVKMNEGRLAPASTKAYTLIINDALWEGSNTQAVTPPSSVVPERKKRDKSLLSRFHNNLVILQLKELQRYS